MSKRVPLEKISKMEALFDQGYSIKQIALRTRTSYYAVYTHIRVPRMVNPDTGTYFQSSKEYETYMASRRRNPRTGRLCNSLTEYKELGVSERINPDTGDPFKTLGEYCWYREKERSKKPENRRLRKIIREGLKRTGKTHADVGRSVGVSESTMERYSRGGSIPHEDVLNRLYIELQTPEDDKI